MPARFTLSELRAPIVQAPMAGGTSTPQLAIAVCRAGGLGFLAGGYRPVDNVREDIEAVRAAVDGPFGVNLFVPAPEPADPDDLRAYLSELAPEAERQQVSLGEARRDDDGWQHKLELCYEEQVPVVSFTFGCPAAAEVDRLHAAGSTIWVTITGSEEARQAQDAGADGLVVQGTEAGGHRGGLRDDRRSDGIGLLTLLRLVARSASVPLIASGGIADGAAVAAVLCAGASAAQIGTAFMLCPEAGTVDAHRALLTEPLPTALTRAFTGRLARGLINRFLAEHSATAPSGYPEIHHATAPLRAAARRRGDADAFNLWAGQAHELARPLPADEIVRTLVAEARSTLAWEGRTRPI